MTKRQLYTRSGLDWSERYLGLPEAFEALECRSALIDGEVISPRKTRGSAFSALQNDLEKGLLYTSDLADDLPLVYLGRRPLFYHRAYTDHSRVFSIAITCSFI